MFKFKMFKHHCSYYLLNSSVLFSPNPNLTSKIYIFIYVIWCTSAY